MSRIILTPETTRSGDSEGPGPGGVLSDIGNSAIGSFYKSFPEALRVAKLDWETIPGTEGHPNENVINSAQELIDAGFIPYTPFVDSGGVLSQQFMGWEIEHNG